MAQYVMALDAGTTSCRCILFNKSGEICSVAQKEFAQYFPQPGWVEHDAEEIWQTQYWTICEAMRNAGVNSRDIAAIGITNQRETTVVWDRESGRPISRAIVWQDRRTAEYCDSLRAKGLADVYRKKTGLTIDPYFSGTKLRWILENVQGAREAAASGQLAFGTIETWLIWKLTGGKAHVTDYSNASRTMLFNINELTWDQEILRELDAPETILPKPVASSGYMGETAPGLFTSPIKITGAAGDQQAALFGQACFDPGSVKNTYGTGCFLLANIGGKPKFSNCGLVTTIAWGVDGKVDYALEGSVFVAGSAVQWLRDQLEIVEKAADTERLASEVADSNGCYVVPALTGLGAPYWDAYARGTIVGLTRGTNKRHIVRATLESIAYQVNDLLTAMSKDAGTIATLKVDGGASANNLLMQMQSDVSQVRVVRPSCVETTALGAAYLAGLHVGYWADKEDVVRNWKADRDFCPGISVEERSARLQGWNAAVAVAREYARLTKK